MECRTETWKDLQEYDRSYSVSDLGRIRSNERVATIGGGRQRRIPESIRVLSIAPDTGQVTVPLYSDNVGKNHVVSWSVSRRVGVAC